VIGIIKCEIRFSNNIVKDSRGDILLQFLDELPWSPPFLDHHPEIEPKLSDLYSDFPESASYLKESHLRTIYHASSDTWGIITEAALDTLDIRFSNPITERLKQTSEAIVNEFMRIASDRTYSSTLTLDFKVIQILDKEYNLPVYVGEVLHQGSMRSAMKEQKLEFAIGVISLAIAIILLYITSPLAGSLFKAITSIEWSSWLSNNAIQLSTATLAVALVSFLKIILYAIDLRKIKPIRWRLAQPV
jgi:hypothetical protein